MHWMLLVSVQTFCKGLDTVNPVLFPSRRSITLKLYLSAPDFYVI